MKSSLNSESQYFSAVRLKNGFLEHLNGRKIIYGTGFVEANSKWL
jgi:hypothetical protein